MNAGMYEEDRSPVGLYVEGGKALRPFNQRSGSGNFYLKPNGILFIHGEDARIMTTEHFASERPKVDFATQSGPMLVIGGQVHPRIKSGSTSRKFAMAWASWTRALWCLQFQATCDVLGVRPAFQGTARIAQRTVFGWRDLQPLCACAASIGLAIPNGTHSCSLCAEVRISGLARWLHRSDASKGQARG